MIHILTMETTNFSFLAVGQTDKQAKLALAEGVAKHLEQCELPSDAQSLIIDFGTGELPAIAGSVERPVCYRDGAIIWEQ